MLAGAFELFREKVGSSSGSSSSNTSAIVDVVPTEDVLSSKGTNSGALSVRR